jgi:hypothetical protein
MEQYYKRTRVLKKSYNIRKISEYVYAGEGKALSGEPIYFGMEYFTQEKWLMYRDNAERMSNGWNSTLRTNGLLLYYARHSEPHNRPPHDDKVRTLTGFTRDEYNNFMEQLYTQGLYQENKVKALESISAGCAGFLTDKNVFYEIAYVSKEPVTGPFPFKNLKENMSVKEFLTAFDKLLMCVGSRIDENSPHTVYENRGIFINPASFLHGGYSGLSLMLHGFTAAVMHEIYPTLQYMAVSPLRNMFSILRKHIDPDDIYIKYILEKNGDYSKDENHKRQQNIFSLGIEKLFPQERGLEEFPVVIKINPLKRFYTHPKPVSGKHSFKQ